MSESAPSPPPPLLAALRGICPRCGNAPLFWGRAAFQPRCRSCGLYFAGYNVGDGPAAFLILIVGGLVTGGAIWLELAATPPYWVHLIWVPAAAALTVAGLRFGKAWLLAQEYSNGAREGRLRE